MEGGSTQGVLESKLLGLMCRTFGGQQHRPSSFPLHLLDVKINVQSQHSLTARVGS